MERIFFDDWQGLWRTLIVAVLAYPALIAILRVSGKRTLSKMNAFDLIVTVALGSTLATILLSKDVALAEGLLALSLLVGLQYVVAWLSCRVRTFENVVKSEPKMLFYRGQFLHDALRGERVTESEVRAAMRAEGYGALQAVSAVVLETDGTFSVVEAQQQEGLTALQGVRGYGSSADV